ncbi:MAG: tyrosine-type recombinase/integrase [bacterium]
MKTIIAKFIKLMKGAPPGKVMNSKPKWIIDESKYLNESEVARLRQAANRLQSTGLRQSKFSLVRTCFMLELGLQAGLRVSEMAALKHQALLLDNGRSSILVNGKGNKTRPVWISLAFKKACFKYSADKESFNYSTDGDSCLLNNLQGEGISKRALQKAFKQLLELAGLPMSYHIHCLRHTYSTFLLRASNNNYRFVQQQLGHASIRTTQVYAGVMESEGRKAVEKLYG